jgi:hypothetical protein
VSAVCNQCGTDIVYPEGTWPLGECPVCGPSRWRRFTDDELVVFRIWNEQLADMAVIPDRLREADERLATQLTAEIKQRRQSGGTT